MISEAALQARLKQLARSWVSGSSSESPTTALERSLARFDLRQPAIAGALEALIGQWREIMPSLERCRAEILAPAFERLPVTPRAITAGLTLSAPASGRAPLSLGWAERRWRDDGKLAAKIRVSAFFDSAGQLYWDFGVAGRSPPPLASLRRGVEAAARAALAYSASLDLTPSHEKAAWLALRLGGRPSDRAAYIEALRQGRWADVRHNAMSFTAQILGEGAYDPTASRDWAPNTGNVIGNGWQNIRLAHGSGNVIFAIDENGALRWHSYRGNGESNRAATVGWHANSGNIIGNGWGDVWQLFGGYTADVGDSRRGHILFAVITSGELRWYRYSGNGESDPNGARGWHQRSGSVIAQGW